MKDIWPVPLQEIMFYISYLFKSGRSYSTVSCYLAGLSYHNKMNNFEDNTQRFIVRKMIEGIKRSRSCKDTRLPITREILNSIISILPCICSSQFECRLFKSVFSLAFHGMFRVGELTVDSKGVVDHTITVDNTSVNNGILEIYLATSKTDQFGSGTILQICPQENKNVCPVMAFLDYMKVRPLFAGPLFCHFDGRPLSKYQFSALLKKSLAILGLAGANFKSHSFRIGMATTMAMEGMSDENIKIFGRWKSNSSYLRYIRIPI